MRVHWLDIVSHDRVLGWMLIFIVQKEYFVTDGITFKDKTRVGYVKGLVVGGVRFENVDSVREDDIHSFDSRLISGSDEQVTQQIDWIILLANNLSFSFVVKPCFILEKSQIRSYSDSLINRWKKTIFILCDVLWTINAILDVWIWILD